MCFMLEDYSTHILFGKGLSYTVVRSESVHTKTTRDDHDKRWRYFYSSIELVTQMEGSFATNMSQTTNLLDCTNRFAFSPLADLFIPAPSLGSNEPRCNCL